MPYYMTLAFKNIFRQKKRSFTLGINYFVIALLILLLLSFSEGVKKNFSGNLVSVSAGHITITGESVVKGKTMLGIVDYPAINSSVKELFGEEARIVTRYKLSSTVYNRGMSKRLSFQGIDTETDTAFRGQIAIREGSWDDYAQNANGVLVSRATAEYLELGVGDEVVIAARTRFGAFNTATIMIKGIYDSANYFVQDIVLCHFDFLQAFDLNDTASASSIYVYFPTLDNLGEKRDALVTALGSAGYRATKPASDSDALNAISGASPQYKMLDASINEKSLKVATVNEVIGLLTQVLAAVNGAGFAVAAIMLFITAISIFINMRMTINDRMQEIGTLRAIGTEFRDIVLMLIFENVFLSLIFVIAGLLGGVGVIAFVGNFVTLPPAGMLSLFLDNGHLVLIPTIGAFASITASVLAFTSFFSYFPARHGGHVSPATALGKVF